MKFGLIGHPIAHSLSPALFKAGYDSRYQYDLIETDDFEEAYSRFLKDYDGINVTAPFKQPAFHKADILSEECQRIGATNLLIKTPEGIKAYNSDYLGVRQWLSEVIMKMMSPTSSLIASPHTATVMIVGLGGAGKAAAEAAKSLGYRTILMNRTRFSEEVRPLEEFCEWFRTADIIIYNIPTAIPQLEDLTDDDFRGLPGDKSAHNKGEEAVKGTECFTTYSPKVVLEANYKDPSFSNALINRMIEANPQASYVRGETWLLYQALTGYELFTMEKPDLENMSDIVFKSH